MSGKIKDSENKKPRLVKEPKGDPGDKKSTSLASSPGTPTKWFLGFDCATKTLAFGLIEIWRMEYYVKHRERLWKTMLRLAKGELSSAELAAFDKETAALLKCV